MTERLERFTALDKNFLNYPLARSRVTKSWHWRRHSDGWIDGTPPRYTGFEFQMPPGTPRALWRCPTGFEVNLLMELSAKAQALGNDWIEFGSIPALLKVMGVSDNSHYCKRVREALTYWRRVEVRYLKWYLGRGDYQEKVIKPIRVLKFVGARIRIRLAPEFTRRPKKYFKRIPLPLPHNETVQNITLCMLAWRWQGHDDLPDDELKSGPRTRLFIRKVGLGSHKNNGAKLADAMVAVRAWYENAIGWSFRYWIEKRRMEFWRMRGRDHAGDATRLNQTRRVSKREIQR